MPTTSKKTRSSGAGSTARLKTIPPPRPFGLEQADLDFDFDTTDRLVLATALAARCSRIPPGADAARLLELVWALPVSRRIARLLRIVALTEDSNVLTVTLRCPSPSCRRPIDVELALERLLAGQDDDSGSGPVAPVDVEIREGAHLHIRRPTGRDQRDWRTESFSTQQEALLHVVNALTVAPCLDTTYTDQDLTVLAAAMEEVDPLSAFRVSTGCPHCGDSVTIIVDLETEVLHRLGRIQQRLLREVHALASHYGWTEAGILGIPAKRRARYLRLIEASESPLP